MYARCYLNDKCMMYVWCVSMVVVMCLNIEQGGGGQEGSPSHPNRGQEGSERGGGESTEVRRRVLH
jgi:hypothetical protein